MIVIITGRSSSGGHGRSATNLAGDLGLHRARHVINRRGVALAGDRMKVGDAVDAGVLEVDGSLDDALRFVQVYGMAGAAWDPMDRCTQRSGRSRPGRSPEFLRTDSHGRHGPGQSTGDERDAGRSSKDANGSAAARTPCGARSAREVCGDAAALRETREPA